MHGEDNWQIITEVSIEGWPGIRISTVLLPTFDTSFDLWQGKPYETCVFADNGDSHVVARYPTKDDAITGHAEWVEHFNNR